MEETSAAPANEHAAPVDDHAAPVDEHVVLLDDAGAAVGVARKAQVHHGNTPRHLAFSCYVFDERARLLDTTRALDKGTFPGLTTNTVCGHPSPGESLADAIRRRARDELGLAVREPVLVLPDFAYDATMDGIRENEACPVFVARVDASVGWALNPAEVHEARWEDWASFRDGVLSGSRAVSPWCALQVSRLDALGPDPLAWPAADPALLPAAARAG